MYVSSLLDKETSMYPGSARCSSNNLPVQNFVSTPPYSDYMGYHHVPTLDTHGQPAGTWGSHYGPQREDWNAYGPGPSSTVAAAQINGSPPGQVSYSSADYSSLHPAGSGGLPPVETINAQQISPNSQRHSSYEWMRKTVQANATGKTRTKEKYRVVYTDHQRLELEKEFHCNRYITIRRKSELAANLGLSERQVHRDYPSFVRTHSPDTVTARGHEQHSRSVPKSSAKATMIKFVKIWFQNRRAKERKMIKKKISQFDGSGGSVQSDSGSLSPNEISSSLFPPPHGINGLQPNDIHQVIVSE